MTSQQDWKPGDAAWNSEKGNVLAAAVYTTHMLSDAVLWRSSDGLLYEDHGQLVLDDEPQYEHIGTLVRLVREDKADAARAQAVRAVRDGFSAGRHLAREQMAEAVTRAERAEEQVRRRGEVIAEQAKALAEVREYASNLPRARHDDVLAILDGSSLLVPQVTSDDLAASLYEALTECDRLAVLLRNVREWAEAIRDGQLPGAWAAMDVLVILDESDA